jgi:hypothetical protein
MASDRPKRTVLRPFNVMIPAIVGAEPMGPGFERIAPRPQQMRITVWAFDAEGAVERLQDKLHVDLDLNEE